MKVVATVRKFKGDGGMLGFADITISDAIVVKGLTIREGKNGAFVTFPSKKLTKPFTDKEGNVKEYEDIVFPITKEARESIVNAVLTAYEKDGDSKPKASTKKPTKSEADDDDSFPF